MGDAVVVGAGVAGIQAALDIAGHGIHVHLIEREPSIGGHMAQLDKTFPTNDCSMCILSPKMVDVARHPGITIHTCSEVEKIEGEAGHFRVTVKKHPRFIDETSCTGCGDCVAICPVEVYNRFDAGIGVRKAIYKPHAQAVPDIVVKDPEHCIECGLCYDACGPGSVRREDKEKEIVLDAASIVLTTGYSVFDARNKSQFGYLTLPDVITSLELERMINASGPTGGKIQRLSTGAQPSSVVFIQCVGSRDMTVNRPYCSCVCCMQAIKNAILIKEKNPSIDITLCYMDIRSYGKGYEEYYERAKGLGIRFLRGMPSDILANKNGLILQLENSETSEVQILHPELVVLSVGMGPASGLADLAGRCGIALEETGFVRPVHDAVDTVASLRPGIYVAGTAAAPKDIPDSVASGGAAAMRAYRDAVRYGASSEDLLLDSHPGTVESPEETPGRTKGAVHVNTSPTLWWDSERQSIRYIAQTLLPGEYRIAECRTVRCLARAIQRLDIRGAPALGVAGGFGVALTAVTCRKKSLEPFMDTVIRDGELLRATRPTAVNLGWGIDRVLAAMKNAPDVPAARERALQEAETIFREDTECCHAIGRHGAALLPGSCTVLTHCNAGSLACSSWGTALGVIRSATEAGKQVRVIACETRPLLQGARLTAWELSRDGIPVTVITDSMAAHVMRTMKIDAVIVGADRITGDAVFNKIGTYMHAVCARHHAIPLYVAAPLSTFDPSRQEKDVIIEERGRDEVARIGNRTFVPDGAAVKNPAFDATPMDLVTAVITENGVIRPPFDIHAVTAKKTK